MQLFIGLLIPFLGTTLGAGMVFLMKNKINSKIEKLLLGFASGVMIAASVWSLIIPSIDMAEKQGKVAWIPATIGFLPEGMAVGVTFAGAILGNTGITMTGAFALAVRNCNSKLSRGCNYFNAFKNRRNVKVKIIFIWNFIRNC